MVELEYGERELCCDGECSIEHGDWHLWQMELSAAREAASRNVHVWDVQEGPWFPWWARAARGVHPLPLLEHYADTTPPLGLTPKEIWDAKHPEPTAEDKSSREEAVRAAIQRYANAGKTVPQEWHQELATYKEGGHSRPTFSR